ncbi:MAG: tryptophan synthase subunit alpha [Armatimonadota bacterium]
MTLTEKFSDLASRGEKALVCFFTAGDQPLVDLPRIVSILEEAGADAIEIGIPFSDPFGEGPTIQHSSQRALENGATVSKILDAISRCNASIPLVTMGYYNPILRTGLDAYATGSKQAGCTGTIISDLIPDEADDWDAASARAGLETIYLCAPTSTSTRIEEVARRSTGFVYAVSRTGVTGAESAVPPEVKELVARVRALTPKPVCVGFGISKPEHVRMVCSVADGAVVGSALVKCLHEHWGTADAESQVSALVKELKAATH